MRRIIRFFVILLFVNQLEGVPQFSIKTFNNCDVNNNNSLIYLENVHVTQQTKNNYIINGNLIVSSKISKNLNNYMLIIFSKTCDDLTFTPETCRNVVAPITLRNICILLDSPLSPLSFVFKYWIEHPSCPINKNVYVMKNIPLNWAALLRMISDMAYLNVDAKVKIYDDLNKQVACIRVQFAVRPKRNS